VRWRALQALGKLDCSSLEDKIVALLKDESGQVRAEAARILGKTGKKEFLSVLVPLLDDEGVEVKSQAIEALGEIKDVDEASLNKFISFLKDANDGIRMNAAMALGKCRYLPALPHLIGALKDAHHSVRGISAWSLGNLGDEKALEPLIEALGDDGEHVRIFAYQAIASFGSKAISVVNENIPTAEPDLKTFLEKLSEDILEGDMDQE